MGYGRKHSWKGDRRDNDRRGSARPKLALMGAIVLAIGILLIFYVADVRNFDNYTGIGGICILAGTLMLLFSLSRRKQIQVARGMEKTAKIFRDSCQCCKCQNCGRSHNHWVHDDDDDRRRHY